MASVFRKSSIERLSSPDKLDCLLKVTTPMSWLCLLVVAVLSAVLIVWAFFGRIPTAISATGILVNGNGTNTIFSETGGTIKKLYVLPGDHLKNGTKVADVILSSGNTTSIMANQEGIVSKILVEEDAQITPNNEILRISPYESERVAVCYVSLDVAKQLKEGMSTSVYLSSANSGTYGHMNGKITNIDSYVSTQTAMSEITGMDGQLAYVLTQSGPVVAVTCRLDKDEQTSSGYYFTSNRAKNLNVTSGELLNVQIETNSVPPIAKIFPMLEEK